MRSLIAHLGDQASHDRLPFHPSCPICRQTRLTGQLPADELLPSRTQALLAAGVLAVSSAAPGAVAFAAEQDQQQDGTAAVTQTTTDPADSPEFDPGGTATDLPNTAPPVPQTQAPPDPGNDDTAAVDQTSATNPNDPVVDLGDGSDSTATGPATSTVVAPSTTASDTSTTAVTAPTPAPATTDTTAPPTSTPAPAPPEASVAPQGARRASRSSRGARRLHEPAKAARGRAVYVSPSPAAPTAVTQVAAPSATVAATSTPAGGEHAKPGDRMHTVLPGESLWTIATDLLGREATTAKVAREVHRLWQLNRDRIGTGDPNLVIAGTRLELR
jgi:hypothetical protein